VAVVSYGSTCVRCYTKQRDKKSEIEWALKSSIGVQPENPKPRTCTGCGKDCDRDNCDVMIRHGKSWYRPPCKECSLMKRASLDANQRAAKYFDNWWLKRSPVFKSHVLADGFALTVFHRGVCVGVPQLSGREVAHLRLQAQGSTSMDWYDQEPLVAGDRDPIRRFSTDRLTYGRDMKMLPYSHRRQCTVAASVWKNLIFWDLILEQRVEYMLHWCDPEKREEGFRKADAILLGLFEGFNLGKEMKVAFTEQDEYRWRVFCNSKRNKKERVAWDKHEWRYFLRVCQGIDLCSGLKMARIGQLGNIDRLTSDGEYRLGGCIYIPVGLNFGKELLEDFKTSKLFQGSDLENCQKGIRMLRDLMIETAEKMKHRLPQLLEEHAGLIAGLEDNDNQEAQVLEETAMNTCDQYEPALGDMALTDWDTLSIAMDKGNTIDCYDDSAEPSFSQAADMHPWEDAEETAVSFRAFAGNDKDGSISDDDLNGAVPMPSL
ncbi:hypothetical protein KVV02_003861, partial [Mortierella alpina]